MNQNTRGRDIIVGSTFEDRYPKTVARVVKVLVEICYWASQEANRDAVISYLANTGYGADITKEEYAGPLKDRFNPTINAGVKTGFGNVMTTTVRRARDDLNDLARELEEAQLAAKQAEKKAPMKKK